MNLQNPIILCVDDEEANIKLLENILTHKGYTAATGARCNPCQMMQQGSDPEVFWKVKRQ